MKKIEIITAVLLLPVAIAITLGSENFYLSLLKSMAFQVAAFCMLLFIYWLFRKRIWRSGIALLSALIIATILPPVFSTDIDCAVTGKEVRIAHFNVNKSNNDHSKTIKAALESYADFISFQEIDKLWEEALVAGLSNRYPYWKIVSRETCCYGLAVFSKHPLCNTDVFYVGGIPNITGDISFGDTNIHFVASHTSSPVSYSRYNSRNEHIRIIAEHLSNIQGPKIALGDYNTVPWDSIISEFKRNTNLQDSRNSWSPTFPSYLPLAQIPIDYIFYSDEFICLRFSTIKDTSSDHFGILGSYELKT